MHGTHGHMKSLHLVTKEKAIKTVVELVSLFVMLNKRRDALILYNALHHEEKLPDGFRSVRPFVLIRQCFQMVGTTASDISLPCDL